MENKIYFSVERYVICGGEEGGTFDYQLTSEIEHKAEAFIDAFNTQMNKLEILIREFCLSRDRLPVDQWIETYILTDYGEFTNDLTSIEKFNNLKLEILTKYLESKK